ncbi:MAG TPA: hypothetical protein VIL49_08525, partial [Capillimicrobium sp.]
NLAGGGSLTVIATSPAPVGGETTVIALDRAIAALGTFPALALAESGALRAELLVGETGVEALRAATAGGEFEPPAVEAVAEVALESEVEPEPEPEPEPKPKAKAKPKGKAKAKAKPKAAPEEDAPAEPEAESEAAPKAKAAAKRKPSAKKKPAAAKKKPAARSRAKKPAADA